MYATYTGHPLGELPDYYEESPDTSEPIPLNVLGDLERSSCETDWLPVTVPHHTIGFYNGSLSLSEILNDTATHEKAVVHKMNVTVTDRFKEFEFMFNLKVELTRLPNPEMNYLTHFRGQIVNLKEGAEAENIELFYYPVVQHFGLYDVYTSGGFVGFYRV
jgi:hypothetical protein